MVGMLCFMGVLAAVALTLCRLEDNKSRRIFIDYRVIKVQQFNAMRSAAQREDFLRNQKRHQEDLINQIFLLLIQHLVIQPSMLLLFQEQYPLVMCICYQ